MALANRRADLSTPAFPSVVEVHDLSRMPTGSIAVDMGTAWLGYPADCWIAEDDGALIIGRGRHVIGRFAKRKWQAVGVLSHFPRERRSLVAIEMTANDTTGPVAGDTLPFVPGSAYSDIHSVAYYHHAPELEARDKSVLEGVPMFTRQAIPGERPPWWPPVQHVLVDLTTDGRWRRQPIELVPLKRRTRPGHAGHRPVAK